MLKCWFPEEPGSPDWILLTKWTVKISLLQGRWQLWLNRNRSAQGEGCLEPVNTFSFLFLSLLSHKLCSKGICLVFFVPESTEVQHPSVVPVGLCWVILVCSALWRKVFGFLSFQLYIVLLDHREAPKGPSSKGMAGPWPGCFKRVNLLFILLCFEIQKLLGATWQISSDTGWWADVFCAAICPTGAVPISGVCVVCSRRPSPHDGLARNAYFLATTGQLISGWEAWKYAVLLRVVQDSLRTLTLLSVPVEKAFREYFCPLRVPQPIM